MKASPYTQHTKPDELLRAADNSLAIIIFAVDGTILSANDNYLKLSGYTRKELLGKNHKALCTGEHVLSPAYRSLWDRLLSEKCSSGLFYRQRKDGSLFWIHAAYHTFFADDKTPERITAFCHDATEQMLAFGEKMSQLQAINDSTIMAEYSPEGEILAVNGNFAVALNGGLENPVGKNMAEVFPLRTNDKGSFQEVWEYIATGHTYSSLLEWTGGNGEPVWLETTFTPVFDASKRLQKVVQIATDVSWRIADEKQREAAGRLLALMPQKTGDAVAITDGAGKTLYINESFSRIFGYTAKELQGKSPACVFGPDERLLQCKILEGSVDFPACRTEAVTYSKNGDRRWVSVLADSVFDERGARECLILTLTDITERKLHHTLQSKALESIAHELPTGAILHILCQEVERVIPHVYACVTGVDASGALYTHASPSLPLCREIRKIRVSDNNAPSARAIFTGQDVVETDIPNSEYSDFAKNLLHSLGIRSCLANPIMSGKGRPLGAVSLYSTVSDAPGDLQIQTAATMASLCALVMERDESTAAMRQLTFYDPITALPNRSLLVAGAEQSLMTGSHGVLPFAVLYLDLDRFKRILKAFGHEAGNEVLRLTAKRLSDIKEQEDFLGHVLGNDFVLILPGADAAGAMEKAQRVQSVLVAPFVVNNAEVILTASIGISLCPANGDDVDTLINHAHTALAVKGRENGALRFFSEDFNALVADSVSLESRLRAAIEEGRLCLHYQPQIRLQSGCLHGVEALCRWNSDDMGDIPPGRFIPIAEESGLIENLNDWVVKEACRQLSDWRRRGIGIPTVSINVSPPNFRNPNLPEKILHYLEANGLKPADIILELTEGVLLDSNPATMATIQKAHGFGLHFSLDDFGTGYSSLSYLQSLPISEIKLDQSFVRDLSQSETSRRLSQAVMRIGESLNLTVLAEGIEDEVQLHLLKSQQYHVAQGFLLSRPVSAPELEHWLREWNPCATKAQYCLA